MHRKAIITPGQPIEIIPPDHMRQGKGEAGELPGAEKPLSTPASAKDVVAAESVQPFIVGGQAAEPGAWPWQVLVRPGSFLCGGALIHEEWVLTAAHCVHNQFNVPFLPGQITVVLGEHHRFTVDGWEQHKSISQVIAHPNYNPYNFDNDVALLKLSSPAILNSRVATVPLLVSPTHDALAAPEILAWVTGWGTTSWRGSTSSILMEVSVPIVTNEECNAAYGGITQNMICAGYQEGGKDACQGDSGGPLVVPNGNSWLLAGLVSFGYECARPGMYGGYARVSRYVSWIQQQTNTGSSPTATHTPESTATPTDTVTPTATATPTATVIGALPPTGGNAVRNGDFEMRPNVAWIENSVYLEDLIFSDQDIKLPLPPLSGDYLAWLGGADNEVSILSQTLVAPANQPRLGFHYQIRSSDLCDHDWLYVIVNDEQVAYIKLCIENVTSSWVWSDEIDLSSYAGQEIVLRFRVETNGGVTSSAFLDDIVLSEYPARPTPTPTLTPSHTPTRDQTATPTPSPTSINDPPPVEGAKKFHLPLIQR
jgi:secreted trypsin-like serine protease